MYLQVSKFCASNNCEFFMPYKLIKKYHSEKSELCQKDKTKVILKLLYCGV